MYRTLKRAACLALVGLLAAPALAQELVIDSPELAGLSGFRAYWDKPVVLQEGGLTRASNHGAHGAGPVADWSTDKPGAPAFDAVHRSLLVRFPGAAEKILAELQKGKVIAKAEVELTFVDTEFFPMDYMMPAGMSFMGDLWVRKTPRWHAVAWALRQPWKADPLVGPTFNASVNGKRYWAKYGAQDVKTDRFPAQLGPTEVSKTTPVGRMDVTTLVEDATYGKTVAERLRGLADAGLLVRKWETHDALFNHGGYEYGGAPGHRGIVIKAPRLVITLKDGKAAPGNLAAAADPANLPAAGQPTAVAPTPDQIKAHIQKFGFHRPADMPDWQWQRVSELLKMEGADGFATSDKAYFKWLDELLSIPPRMFRGHHTPLMAEQYHLYKEAMPAPVQDHLKAYFAGWLLPGRDYHELVHNQWMIWTKEENNYYSKTGDWRGNHSFYRDSYTRFMSTMNFNNLATIGALLGGAVIDDPCALDDGRHGLETLVLRLWSWYDGTTQESIDHYYLGLTLLGQKTFADLGPTHLDRMMGRSALSKTVEELVACYHPSTKRFTSTSGRTGVAYLLAVNEGPSAIMHSLSAKGALHDIGNADNHGMPLTGHDLPPGTVGAQALRGPWAPAWISSLIDDKPFPFEMTASFKVWGSHLKHPLWKRSYLARNYGMASLDVSTGNETVPFMAQWRRNDQVADRVQDVGTLLARYGINQTEFLDSLYHGTAQANPNGSVGTQGGHQVALQHRNKAIVLMSPFKELKYDGGRPIPKEVTSLQASIALLNFQPKPTWKIYLDGKLTEQFPASAKAGCRITIDDGAAWIGIIPIPATDLGRPGGEILLTPGDKPVKLQGGGEAAPTLIINNYNLNTPGKPLDMAATDWDKFDRAYSGFVVELGDKDQFPSFEAFQKHLDKAKLDLKWNDATNLLDLAYTSGADKMELTYRPDYGAGWAKAVPTDVCFPMRKVNGQWPYLADGVERDTTVSGIARTGVIAKHGVTLVHQPGRLGYLLVEPRNGALIAANPLPDLQYLSLALPSGRTIAADGRLAMTQITLAPQATNLDVEYATKPSQVGPEMATALVLSGFAKAPAIRVNGAVVKPIEITIEGKKALAIPLDAAAKLDAGTVVANLARHAPLQKTAFETTVRDPASLRYESGEHYLLSEPSPGAYSFWRQWPGPSPVQALLPNDVSVTTDGAIALQRLTVDPVKHAIAIDYAPYLQQDKDGKPLPGRAQALVVLGFTKPPTTTLHGKPYAGKVATVTLDGRTAYIVPLFGDEPDAVAKEVEGRYRAVVKTLADATAKR